METLIIAAIIIGLYMAWNIGANDVANSMADAVGSKALTIFWAVILAGIFEFAGAVLVGSHVTNTIRKGIIESQVFAQ
ncbi:MAG TPA: inorganic phosphate transporter, partial [Phycisphaerales bacterium]|nr:inorganic phosphate transporter [Phycisphaerales bacterium]